MLALAVVLATGVLARAGGEARAQASGTRATIAVLPYGTTVEEIAARGAFSLGVVSPGLGRVPAAQTYLDITQGNRINESLYEDDLPALVVRDGEVPGSLWERTRERAADAPADLAPGLLASTLRGAGVPVRVVADSGQAALVGVDEGGRTTVVPRRSCGERGCGPGLGVLRASLAELERLAAGHERGDLLLAITAAPPRERLLPAGVLGDGFDGNLTSDTTRRAGIVTTTDIAPTLLEHFGVEVPSAVNGSAIRSEGGRDAADVAELQERLAERASRELVALLPLGIWLLLVGLAAFALGRRGARPGLLLLGLSCAWGPAVLLAAAVLDLGELASALATGVGAPALAVASAALATGYRALALACAVTVVAHAVDVVAGSPYTSLSALGPNPGGGVRFFGIGNELEATLTTLTLIGAGAWLATRRGMSGRGAALGFAIAALLAAAAFAPGRFGADVGAAIVLGVGGATAAVLSLGLSRRRAAAVVAAAGVAALAALVVVDLALGGAHFSRSVLGAGEPAEVANALERRVRLMAGTFTDPVYPELLALASVLLVAGIAARRRVLGWFGSAWPARNGFLGAVAGVLVGTVANDSGSVLLVIGMVYIAAAAGFFWAAEPPGAIARRPPRAAA